MTGPAPEPRSLYLIPNRGWLVEYAPRVGDEFGGDPMPWVIYGRTPISYAVIARTPEQPEGCVELVPRQ